MVAGGCHGDVRKGGKVGLGFHFGRWRKMMTWQCFISVDVFARINATWLVLVGQF